MKRRKEEEEKERRIFFKKGKKAGKTMVRAEKGGTDGDWLYVQRRGPAELEGNVKGQ